MVKRKYRNNMKNKVGKRWRSFEEEKISKVSDFILDVDKTKMHVMIELTHMDYQRVKKNCIFLSGLTCRSEKDKEKKQTRHTTIYSNATIGENIKFKEVTTNDNIKIHKINLDATKYNYACAIIDKKDILQCKYGKQVVFLPSSVRWTTLSGMIILIFMQLGCETGTKWTRDDVLHLQKCKQSVVGNKNHPHFGAKGEYFSFGLSSVYKIDNNSSVGTYSSKQYSSYRTQSKVITFSKQIEDKLKSTISSCFKSTSSIFHMGCNWTSASIDAAYELQNDYGDININASDFLKLGTPQLQICINATTNEYHTEFDQSFTLIGVPRQEGKCGGKYYFSFLINDHFEIKIPMKIGVNFMFSALFLTHRQETNQKDLPEHFINFASFLNKKLFSHIRKSFHRVRTQNKYCT